MTKRVRIGTPPPRPVILVLDGGEVLAAKEVQPGQLADGRNGGLTVIEDVTINPPEGLIARRIDMVALADATGEDGALTEPTLFCRLQTPIVFGEGQGLFLPRRSLVLAPPEPVEAEEGAGGEAQ